MGNKSITVLKFVNLIIIKNNASMQNTYNLILLNNIYILYDIVLYMSLDVIKLNL